MGLNGVGNQRQIREFSSNEEVKSNFFEQEQQNSVFEKIQNGKGNVTRYLDALNNPIPDRFEFGKLKNDISSPDDRLNSYPATTEPDETYVDKDGKDCKVFYNDDGSYQIEKSSDKLFDKLNGKNTIERYNKDGKLVQKQADGVVYSYDENGNLAKTTRQENGKTIVVLYNEDGSIQKEHETKKNSNGDETGTIKSYKEDGSLSHEIEYTKTPTGGTATSKYYKEDGSYIQLITNNKDGEDLTETEQIFDKHGNPISEIHEVGLTTIDDPISEVRDVPIPEGSPLYDLFFKHDVEPAKGNPIQNDNNNLFFKHDVEPNDNPIYIKSFQSIKQLKK